jgi:hypothetical protein
MRSYLQIIVSTNNEPADDSLRALIGLSASLDTAAIVSVTSDSVCTRGTRAVDSAFGVAPNRTVGMIMYRVGPSYALFDDSRTGPPPPASLHFIDSTFTYSVTLIW